MNRTIKTLLILIVTFVLLSGITMACSNEDDSSSAPEQTSSSSSVTDNTNTNVTYSVTLKRSSGDPFVKANVLAYTMDGALAAFGNTDDNGTATFTAPAGTYKLQFGLLPEGYPTGAPADNSYTVSSDSPSKTFKLSASLLETPMDNNTSYELGDVMHDFSFTDTYGNKSSLSEVLTKKKAVLINFWYVGCTWCVYEFPAMNTSYRLFSDKIEILGLNTSDTKEQINDFAKNKSGAYDWDELNFTMVDKTNEAFGALYRAFDIKGAPTSIIIDREGVVCFTHEGPCDESEFIELFNRYTSDPYEQKIYFPGVSTQERPNVEAPTSSQISKAIDNGSTGMNATYRFDEDEYNWPWVVEGNSIKSSNASHNNSYAIIYADIQAKKGQCIAFDYKLSCESNADYLHVFVDGLLQQSFSGIKDWQTCYAYVPVTNGKCTVSLVYLKDESQYSGEDAVWVRNMRFVDPDKIDQYTEIKYRAAYGKIVDNAYENYETAVYNEEDGYFHIDSYDGPIVLANLMEPTGWSDISAWNYILSENLIYDFDEDGTLEDYTDYFTMFCGLANNSVKYGLIGVTWELKYCLDVLVTKFSDYHPDAWLELCYYYKLYNSDVEQLEDPITGLSFYTAYTAVVNEDKDNPQYNHVNKRSLAMPLGIWYEFVPTETAVYKIYSVGDIDSYCWLRDADLNQLEENDDDPNSPDYMRTGNFAITRLFEKGETYYILVDFNFSNVLGEFDFLIERLAVNGYVWTPASAGEYTQILDENGNVIDFTVGGAIDYVLNEKDNIYYKKNADGSLGSKIYVNLTQPTSLFADYSIEEMVNIGCYYCKVCGSKYHTSIASFEAEEDSMCWICGNEDKKLFEKRKAFELPTPLMTEEGYMSIIRYDYDDGSVNAVPMYELNNGVKHYSSADQYLADLRTYGIKFTDYTSVIESYIELSRTEGGYPTEKEIGNTQSHKGNVAATKELVDVLKLFIIFGDYSLSPMIDNTWLMLSSYYKYLG